MILLVRDDRQFLCSPGAEVHTDMGVIDVPEDPTPGQTVETHLGEPFIVQSLRGPDLFDHLERTGAPMLPKDIGLVVGHTGVAASDTVLDAGTGTGVLAAYLGRLGADVITYERDQDFASTARTNMEVAGVSQTVEVRDSDIRDDLDSLPANAFDLVTLDTEDASTVIESVPTLLEPGAFVAVYSPFIEQARTAETAAIDAGLQDVETVETIQRPMDFDDRGSRPTTGGVGHTGYLTFARYRPQPVTESS